MFDFHCHSYYSDGQYSPEALVGMAIDARVSMLALTDHDTLNGVAELMTYCKDTSVTAISGIELTARFKTRDIHIVGLQMSLEDEPLNDFIILQKGRRKERAVQISRLLETYGIDDVYDKVHSLSKDGQIARPHFAQILVEAGLVPDMQTAFKRYLGKGCPCFVPVEWPSIEETVSVILRSGGHAVLAHPLIYDFTATKLRELATLFKDAGGEAIEIVSGIMRESDVGTLSALSKRFDFLASSGSDFHTYSMGRAGIGRQTRLPKDMVPVWTLWT